MAQGRDKLLFTANDFHRQHNAGAFAGVLEEGCEEMPVSSSQAECFQRSLGAVQVTQVVTLLFFTEL